MTEPSVRGWLNQALRAAVTVVVVALLLSWAWSLLKPLLPALAIGGALALLVLYGLKRWRY